MIVAITGGTGFIGRKLVQRHVAQGDQVRVLSRRDPGKAGLPDAVRWTSGDLAHPPDLAPFVVGADILYHCAGEIRDETRMQAVHVEGTRRLLEAAAGKVRRWVQLSSTGAYGQYRDGAVTEETALRPVSTYEETKAQADALVEAAAASGALEYVILRPSNVYAQEMSNRSLFGLISMVQRGWFFFIGRPGASANYIHVDNVVEALLLCATTPDIGGRIYNLSDHRTLEAFIATIATELGVTMPEARMPQAPVRLLAAVAGLFPGMPLTASRVDALTNRVTYPTTRIERELGYRPIISMEEGLQELVGYWKSQEAGKGAQ